MQQFLHPFTIIFTLATTFGVLVHDTHIDSAAGIAMALPAAVAGYASVEVIKNKAFDHTHVEKHGGVSGTLRASVPRLQPRDDQRHILMKRMALAYGSDYMWPSD